MNENYVHPDMPAGAGSRHSARHLQTAREQEKAKEKVQLMGAGTILREVEAAAELLRDNHGVESDVWSVTSVNELTRDAQKAERWNRYHPRKSQKALYH